MDQSQSDRDRNRAAFPQAVEVMDDHREVFGPGVKLTWAKSADGRMVGKQEKREEYPLDI